MSGERTRQLGAAVVLVFGLFMAYHAWRLGMGEPAAPGPGFAPFLAAVALVVITASHLRPGGPDGVSELRLPAAWREMVVVVASLFGYALVVEPLGFVPTTFVWLVMLLGLTKPRRGLHSVVGAALTVLVAYVVFAVLFSLQLPRGVFGF